MNTAVIVFSTHLKLHSLINVKHEIEGCEKILFLTPQYVFDNERNQIYKLFSQNIEFLSFADLMTDADGEKCDTEAFDYYFKSNKLHLSYMGSYFHDLTIKKNQLLIDKVEKFIHPQQKIILSDDLGIVSKIWEESGYKRYYCEYYYNEIYTKSSILSKLINKKLVGRIARKFSINYPNNLLVSIYEGKRIIYHGHLERAGYRINLEFHKDRIEELKHWFIKLLYVIFKIRINRKNVINLSTLHEYGNYAYYEMIDIPEFHNYIFQDGYLPPNDTCRYLYFYGRNSIFLTWDKLGLKLFDYQNLSAKIMPCRNVFLLPPPSFKPIKKVLCVSSGAGDWTAIKNRSDEDKTVLAFVEMAKRYPDVNFVYRCHPSWVSSGTQGVNSISRLLDYFDWLNLPNICLSSNIPSFYDSRGNIVVSHKRSSLDEDLKDVDFIFGVHSVSMLDGALKGIPFASVNLSGRRNLWKGISDLGFPHCESDEEIANVIDSVMNSDFQINYLKAIDIYNKIIQEN